MILVMNIKDIREIYQLSILIIFDNKIHSFVDNESILSRAPMDSYSSRSN